MADRKNKFNSNAAGKFYVDDQCIACDFCASEAKNIFVMNDTDGHAFVIRQPKTPEEIEASLSALRGCPVEAIGCDGDENEGN